MLLLAEVIAAVILSVQGQGESGKMRVGIFYDSLDKCSLEFFQKQLRPALSNCRIKDLLDLELRPFGRSKMELDGCDSWEFHCPNGPLECYANKVHACLIEMLPRSKALHLIFCLTAMEKMPRDIDEFPLVCCAEEVHVSPMRIEVCAACEHGDNVLARVGRETAELGLIDWTPAVVFDGCYDKIVSKFARKNLTHELNEALKRKGLI